ncbi:thiamine-phosphate kinase [Deferribacterales bacterium RsTz2092]|nr:thiamine-monophosphate kinase [Deferribacterales bacterium]
MKEFQFIEELKAVSSTNISNKAYGIGDDAALLDSKTLIATDMMTEGIHFHPSEPINSVIDRLFISNISDIAAMGGQASGYKALLCVSIPPSYDKKALLATITSASLKYNVSLIGGDTTSSTNGAVFSLTIIGKRGRHILTRSNALAGDIVYVSRKLGASRYYLEHNTIHNVLHEAALGELLGRLDGVGACTDVSDGLGRDLANIARASDVMVELDGQLLPIADELAQLKAPNIAEYALSSGEEYALVWTVRPDRAAHTEKTISKKLNRKVHRIGVVCKNKNWGCYLNTNGKLKDIVMLGYEHE